MKWRKLGRIFNPADHKLANNCIEYAQSPQVLLFDDFIRVYFSTRELDNVGKYKSHISFVDFEKDFHKIIEVSSSTVIPLGNLGCFDEHGIFPMNVLRDKNTIIAYTTGWNRKISVSNDASIGFAISTDDGLTFKKMGEGPILTSSLNEPFLIADAFVAIFNKTYYMWYIYGSKWIIDPSETTPQRIYKIVHATSQNGIDWDKEGRHLIVDKLNENECQALPTVIHFNNRYHMFFCYREATGFRKTSNRSYRIGYAHSENCKDWIRNDENAGIDTSEGCWDSEMLCYPYVFEYNDNLYMLYNGNHFGRFGFGLAILESL